MGKKKIDMIIIQNIKYLKTMTSEYLTVQQFQDQDQVRVLPASVNFNRLGSFQMIF